MWDIGVHQGNTAWQLAVHAALLEHLDDALACGQPTYFRLPPAWVHLSADVSKDGTRGPLVVEGPLGTAPRYLVRCLDRALPRQLPEHPGGNRFVRTLAFESGLAEEGFPGPQALRAPLLLGGEPDRAVAGLVLDSSDEAEEEEEDLPRLEESAFVLSAADAVTDLRRRFWLQGLRDALEKRAGALAGCGVDGLLAVGLSPDGTAALRVPEDNACAAEQVAQIRLTHAPDGTPGRLAVHVTPDGLVRAEWPGDQDVLLGEADEEMVNLARDRAGPATSNCYADALGTPFKPAVAGELLIGVVLGSAGEAGDVLVSGELSEGRFARCVADAHRSLVLPAPKDGVPVLLLVRYVFDPATFIDPAGLNGSEPPTPAQSPAEP